MRITQRLNVMDVSNVSYRVDFQEFSRKTIYSGKKKKKNFLDDNLGFASLIFFLEKQNCVTYVCSNY